MTSREAAIIGAHTGVLVGKQSDLNKYILDVLGRPVYSHDLVDNLVQEIKQKSRDDFMNLTVDEDLGEFDYKLYV